MREYADVHCPSGCSRDEWFGAGAVAGALRVGMAPSALASPPNCTAADLAGVAAGVSAATSAYLFVRPDVNDFFTGLEGTPRDTLRASVEQYLDANPSVRTDLAGIRQPLVDFKARCGQSTDRDATSP